MGLLVIGMLFGVLGGLQYVLQGFFKTILSFDQVRPLHVTSVIFWIVLGATGAVMTYMQQHTGRPLYSNRLAMAQWVLFVVAIAAILTSYILGIFGGREYWEFNPWLALPIMIGWILFIINTFRTIGSLRNQPVYVWQWITGVVFFSLYVCRILSLAVSLFQKQHRQRYDDSMEVLWLHCGLMEYAHLWMQYVSHDPHQWQHRHGAFMDGIRSLFYRVVQSDV